MINKHLQSATRETAEAHAVTHDDNSSGIKETAFSGSHIVEQRGVNARHHNVKPESDGVKTDKSFPKIVESVYAIDLLCIYFIIPVSDFSVLNESVII